MPTIIKDSRLTWFLAFLSLVAIVIIAHFKASLELEDAEQAYYTQWWRLGYDDQPPLYTWLQKSINTFFGTTKFSFAFLRGLIFGTILLSLYALGKKILKSTPKAELVVLAAALVPVFIDFAFRRLSHTLLLCLVICLTFLVLANLMERKNMRNYILLGCCFGVGMLAKYNYVLFISALSMSVFASKDLRNIFLDKKMVVSIVIGVLLFSPHLHWILFGHHLDFIKESVAVKMESEAAGIVVLTPLWNTLKAFSQLILPILIISTVMFVQKKLRWSLSENLKWVYQVLLVQLTLLVVFFIVTDVKNVESRWLLPLLLPYLVLWIGLITVKLESLRRWGRYIFIALLVFQTMRTPVEKVLGIASDNQFDYLPLSNKLKEQYPDAVWVLPNVTYGGQLRLLNIDRTIFTLDDFSASYDSAVVKKRIVLATSKRILEPKKPIDSLLQYGPDKDDVFFFAMEDGAEDVLPLQIHPVK